MPLLECVIFFPKLFSFPPLSGVFRSAVAKHISFSRHALSWPSCSSFWRSLSSSFAGVDPLSEFGVEATVAPPSIATALLHSVFRVPRSPCEGVSVLLVLISYIYFFAARRVSSSLSLLLFALFAQRHSPGISLLKPIKSVVFTGCPAHVTSVTKSRRGGTFIGSTTRLTPSHRPLRLLCSVCACACAFSDRKRT